MSSDKDKPLNQHPLGALLRQLDKARELVVQAYEKREVPLADGDARRADRLIKGQILRLNSERDAVTLSPDMRKAFDNALRPHRISLINTDLHGHVELAATLLESLREARLSSDLDQIEMAETDLQECLDGIYDQLDDGSSKAERQVHDNIGTQTETAQRRRMNEFYHQRLSKLTEEYHLVTEQLREAPFDSDSWFVGRVVDFRILTIPVIERINVANSEITAWLHKDRQREERALKIRAVVAKFQADPGFFPSKAAARADKCPGVNRIPPIQLAAAPDLGPNANTTLYTEDVAELAAKLNMPSQAQVRPASTFQGADVTCKAVAPPEGLRHFDALITEALASRTPVSAREYWESAPDDPALPGWAVATFLYALNTHIEDGASTAEGALLGEKIKRQIVTRADHPLSGTERFHDLIIYADTVPEEKLPQAVHYERTAPHAD